MGESYKRLSGWLVTHPYCLHEAPQDITKLMVEVRTMEANFEPHDLYRSKEEALRAVRQYLTEQKEHALINLDILSKSYPEHEMEERRRENQRRLEIAEKGLQLCGGE